MATWKKNATVEKGFIKKNEMTINIAQKTIQKSFTRSKYCGILYMLTILNV